MFLRRLKAILFGWVPVRRKTYDEAIYEWTIVDYKYSLLNATFYLSSVVILWELQHHQTEIAKQMHTFLASYWQRIRDAATAPELEQLRKELANFKLKYPQLGIK